MHANFRSTESRLLDARFPFTENIRIGLDYRCPRSLWLVELRDEETGTELVFPKAERGLK